MRPESDERDDAALLRDVARGDEAALAALYDRHAAWLTVRLTRRCALPDVVDHAVQDTFLALWREARTYRGGGDVAAFIWGIGVRRLIDAIRRENGGRRRPPWRAAEPEMVVSAEDQVLVGIEHGRLGQALAGLSPGLDPEQRLRFRELLSGLPGDPVIVLSTHQGDDIAAICPRVVVLLQGQVRFTGTPAELAATAAGRVWATDERGGGAHLSWRGGDNRWRHIGDRPPAGADLVAPTVEDGYLLLCHAADAR